MPTCYTYDLYKGTDTTFANFVMKCAGAFSVPIEMRDEMRDEPMDVPIPEEFRPSYYHVKKLEKAKADVVRIKAMDDAEADRLAQLEYEQALHDREELVANLMAVRERYEAMLAQVKAWAPPTSGHQRLKAFMIEELSEAIDRDCDLEDLPVAERLTATVYRESKLYFALRSVAYHTEESESEAKWAKQRTEWIRDLFESLKESSDFSAKS